MTDKKHIGATDDSLAAARLYQEQTLPLVSRTFALTIPQLPLPLRTVVTNAYLLARMADSFEDRPEWTAEQKEYYETAFLDVVMSKRDPDAFLAEVNPVLPKEMPLRERDLIQHLPIVLSLTYSFNQSQRQAIERCIQIMTKGMAEFQHKISLKGLNTMAELDAYCYNVAGVVGEMLTSLFSDHSKVIADRRDDLDKLAVSFGQSLQLVNILKDRWEDRENGVCWLPRDLFKGHGIADLSSDLSESELMAYQNALHELVAIAHGHLCNAMHYINLLPANEIGIRRFCFWIVNLAAMTLRRIYENPHFRDKSEIGIPKGKVKSMLALSYIGGGSNFVLNKMFSRSIRGVPLTKQ